jgi:hypothetical protein
MKENLAENAGFDLEKKSRKLVGKVHQLKSIVSGKPRGNFGCTFSELLGSVPHFI